MNTPTALLDKALALAEEEMVMLREGDVDAAQRNASERIALTEQAWTLGMDDSRPERIDPARLVQLQQKLLQLQSIQGRLTTEARRLHATIKEDLLRSRQEGARHAAYGKALRPVSSVAASNRFISKRS
ncbi:hypothetical protein [Megalodesulfovibrio paquesii]